jgi:Mg/Co/Ni transporter MgtE
MATDAPTCRLDEAAANVAVRLPERWDICVVTNDRQVVVGLLGRSALRDNQPTTVERAMTPGPRTIRPSARLDAIRLRFRDQKLTRLVVTRSDGVLLGVVRIEDLS